MSFSKKILLAGLMLFGAFAFYVAPVFAETASQSGAMKQTKSYCWTKSDCKKMEGVWAASKANDCLSGYGYGYCSPKEEPLNLQIHIGSLTSAKSLEEYIPAIYSYLIAIVGIVAIVMIMVGGLQYLTAGSSGRVAEAKNRIIGAVIGLIIALASYTILQTINPALISGKIPTKLKMIAPQWASQWCPNTGSYQGEFECGTKYGPSEKNTTGKTGKALPFASGYCMGAACEKKDSVIMSCIKLSYDGNDTPKCINAAAAKACEYVKKLGGECQGSDGLTDPVTCHSRGVMSILDSSLKDYGLTMDFNPNNEPLAPDEDIIEIYDDKTKTYVDISTEGYYNAGTSSRISMCKGVATCGADEKAIDSLCEQFEKIPATSKIFYLFEG